MRFFLIASDIEYIVKQSTRIGQSFNPELEGKTKKINGFPRILSCSAEVCLHNRLDKIVTEPFNHSI